MASPAILLHPDLPRPTAEGRPVTWGAARGGALALAIAEASAGRDAPLLVLTPTVEAAEGLAAQVRFFVDAPGDVVVFPDPEVLAYDHFSPHPDLASLRLGVLRALESGARPVIVTAATTLLARLPPPDYLRAHSVALAAGDRLAPGELRHRLDAAGYQRVTQVTVHGEYAVRGSLVDFFPAGRAHPVRVDFLDEDVESLREFDPDTQRSTGRIDRLETLPARELPSDEAAIRRFRGSWRERFEGDPTRSPVYREVSEGRLPGGIESYLPLFFDTTASLWDYLPVESLIVTAGDPNGAWDEAWQHVGERYEQLRHDSERPILAPDVLYCVPDVQRQALARHAVLRMQPGELPDERCGPRAANLPDNAPSSASTPSASCATGASLTGSTVTNTRLSTASSPVPMRTRKLSSPLKSWSGT